jgi:hypothetical protein
MEILARYYIELYFLYLVVIVTNDSQKDFKEWGGKDRAQPKWLVPVPRWLDLLL